MLPLLPSSESYLAICVRAGIVRVSVGLLGIESFVFHYWGEGRLFLRLRVVWLYTLVRFALTAIGSFLLVGNGMEIPVSLVA